jgi:prepilin-type N-terminal cleavage/methylation domain-containing protein
MTVNRKSAAGFTVPELLLVVVIVVVLATLAVPNLLPMVELIRLRSTADVIKRQLIVARTRALSDPNIHCGVLFDTDSRPQRTMIFFDRGTPYVVEAADTASKYMGVYAITPAVTMSVPASQGITNRIIVFRGDGSAKNGGSITLTNRYNKVRTVNVLASTGRIRIQ